MKKIKIHHFWGNSVCATMDDVLKTLEQSMDGVNEFYIAEDHTMFPHIVVLVNGSYAYVTCVPDEAAAGLQAFSGDAEMDLDPDGISVFYSKNDSKRVQT